MTKTQEPIRVGIAGAGLMGFWHATMARKVGAKVVAVLDSDAATAEKFAQRFPTAQTIVGADIPARLEQAIDVWHISTPLASHRKLAGSALLTGSHVLVEKPLTAKTAETEQLLSLATERSLLLCPVHQFPFQDGVQQTLRHLPQMEPLTGFHYTVRSGGGEGRSADETAHIAASILPHPLSIIAATLPVNPANISWQVSNPDTAEWLITGHSEKIGISIEISMNGRPTVNRCEIVGSGGTAHLDLFHGYAVFEGGVVSKTNKIIHPFALAANHFLKAGLNIGRRAVQGEPAYPGLRSLIRAFYQAIQDGTPPPISSEEIISIARMSDEIQAQADFKS